MNDHWWLGLKESGIQYDTGRRDHARGRRDPLVGRGGGVMVENEEIHWQKG